MITTIKSLANSGYCLWVGAGIDTYLATNTNIKIPNWRELAKQFEERSNTILPNLRLTIQERLEFAASNIKYYDFKRLIRESILKKVAEAIISHIRNDQGEPPDCIKRMAKLGSVANPIINFNVEKISSQVLANGSGPYSIKTYGKNLIKNRGSITHQGGENSGKFRRHIYHPHGSIDSYGLSVFTESDYKSQSQSLAYQLAVQSAFDDNLFIVGMSLNDEYLKEQIANFRSEIKNIYWVRTANDETNDDLEKWIWKNKIQILEVKNWEEFWELINENFPEQDDLMDGWLGIASSAIAIINDAYETERLIERLKDLMMTIKPIDIEKVNYQLFQFKATFLENGIVFSESLNSPMVISENEKSQLIKSILEKIIEKDKMVSRP
ncbi:MAG: SIR2 family protein [Parafilimonas sp.]|nr:SIR2 family protein [Parafilimonas sp.]